MLRIKMHALYDHFPDHNPVPDDAYIECYADMRMMDCQGGRKNIAMLLEPKSMIKPAYDYVRDHIDLFRYVFTHDAALLKLPNVYELNWADVWLVKDSEKTKGISICTSYKDWCDLHRARLELARYYQDHDGADAYFGDWNNPNIPNVKAEDYLEHYKFSIIIENDLDDWWYTEKILNCFGTKTVPIYVGASRIGERFNADGIIQVENWRDIPSIVEHLDIDREYSERIDAINDNFNRIQPYMTPWKQRFFNNYGGMLEELQNE